MRNEGFGALLRRRLGAFVWATAVVAALWALAVVAADAFTSPTTSRDGYARLPPGVVRLPGGVLKETGPKGHVRRVLLHGIGGSPTDLRAWHTVVQCLILVTLAALVVAGIDRLRRWSRRHRRAQVA